MQQEGLISTKIGVAPNEKLALFAKNDSRTMEELYANNYRTVEKFIVRNSGEAVDAKDIFQEAIIAAWLNVKNGQFREVRSGNIEAYIVRIAKNKWLDVLRSSRFKKTVPMVSDTKAPMVEELRTEEAIQDVAYLKELYSCLDERCKAVLDRFYFEKMSMEDIAKELHLDAGSVRTAKYRCMMKLRKLHLKRQKENA